MNNRLLCSKNVLVVTLCLLAMSPLPGQVTEQSAASPAGQDDGMVTLRVNSDLVLLDVVVHNSRGELIHGLQQEDFTILEDNHAQTISSFEETREPSATENNQPAVQSSEELDRKAPQAPVSIIILDELATQFEDQAFTRYSLSKYLERQGESLQQPTMLIARTAERMMVLCDYTTSRTKLLQALNRHFVGGDWLAGDPDRQNREFAAFFATIIEIAKATEGHKGHKNVIWVGRGLPGVQWYALSPDDAEKLQSAVSKCVDLLRDARITLYSIDPAGPTSEFSALNASGEGAASGRGSVAGLSNASGDLSASGQSTPEDPFRDSVSLAAIARASGGVAMYGSNGIDREIQSSAQSGRNFYTLSYRPHSTGEEDIRKFHRIRVVMKDPKLKAQNREGYYFATSESPEHDNTWKPIGDLSEFELNAAVEGILVYDGLPVTVAQHGATTSPVQVLLPVSAVSLNVKEGKLEGEISLLAYSYDRFGNLLDKEGQTLNLHLAPLAPGQTESRTIQMTTKPLSAANTARVRIVVRDNSSGKLGTNNLFLVDPATLRDPATGLKAQKKSLHPAVQNYQRTSQR